MKQALIIAHPDPASFTHAVGGRVREALAARGHEVLVRDLYAIDFDPRLKRSELVGRAGFGPAPDAHAERELLAGMSGFVFVYPFWLNAPPAMLKGYLDRIFGLGFAFGPGGNAPLLAGRTLLSFTSSGAPSEWARRSGALEAEQGLVDDYLGTLAGLRVLGHIHFGGIVPGIRADVVARHLAEAGAAVARYF